jgi:hypothetical protein
MAGQVVLQVRQVNTVAFRNTTKVVLSLAIYVLTLALLFPSLIKLLSWCCGLKVKMKAPLSLYKHLLP